MSEHPENMIANINETCLRLAHVSLGKNSLVERTRFCDIILDCIGDADVREALGGAGGAAAASTSEAAAAGAPAVAAPPTTGILHPKPAKPYAPYYVQIKSGAPSSSSAPAAPAPAPAAQSASGGPSGEERREAVVKSDDFRSFASFLIDNAIFGILQESAADLWKS